MIGTVQAVDYRVGMPIVKDVGAAFGTYQGRIAVVNL